MKLIKKWAYIYAHTRIPVKGHWRVSDDERLRIMTFRGIYVTLIELVLYHPPIHDIHVVMRDEWSIDLPNISVIIQLDYLRNRAATGLHS